MLQDRLLTVFPILSAILFSLISSYVLIIIPDEQILTELSKVDFLIGTFILISIYSKFKLNELLRKTGFNDSERTQLMWLIEKKSKQLNGYTILFTLTALLFGLASLVKTVFDLPSVLLAIVMLTLLGISVYAMLVIILSFGEIEQFKAKIEQRKARACEVKRQLEKLETGK